MRPVLSLCLFVTSALASPALADPQPTDPPVQAASVAPMVGVPATTVVCGSQVKFSPDYMSAALTQAWNCKNPATPCRAATGSSYPKGWVNNGGNGGKTPKWKCGGTAAAQYVTEFPIFVMGKIFPTGATAPGAYRVFYSVEKAGIPGSSKIHYCGVANHQGSNNYGVCGGTGAATQTIAAATPTAVNEL